MVLSLSPKGLTTAEVSVHLAEVFGTAMFKERISEITDAFAITFDDPIFLTDP